MTFLADENFDRRILRQLRRLAPDVSVLRAQDTGLAKTPDPRILAWAADRNCIVLTHDAATMVGHAYERLAAGLSMPGLVVVPWLMPVGQAVEGLLTVMLAGTEADCRDQVLFLPL